MKNKHKKQSSFGNIFKRLFMGGANDRDILIEEQVHSPARTILKNFAENKIAITGFVLFCIIFLSCIILPIFFPLDVSFQDPTQINIRPGMSFLNVPKELEGNVKSIAVGGSFSIGLDNNGKVYQWGSMNKKHAQLPDFKNEVVEISAGMDHAVALDKMGKVYTWGNKVHGLDEIPLEVSEMDNIKDVVAGYQISFVLTEDGKVEYWGSDNLIDMNLSPYQGKIDKLITNSTTVIGLLKSGEVVFMGSSPESPFVNVPEQLKSNVVDVVSADKAAIGLTADGNIYMWGDLSNGLDQIPDGVMGNVKSISAGSKHFTVVLKDGTVKSWGSNDYKQSTPSITSGVDTVYSGYYQNYAIKENSGKVSTWGLKGYLMGSDQYGRDVFKRLLIGGRMTMTVGAISVIISTIIGVVIGGISGYYSGRIDNILMRFAEIVGAIPFLPFAMILSSILGNKVSDIGRIGIIMVILGVLSWPGLARLVRAQILAEREKEFVTAAKAVGIRETAIIFKHIIPNVIAVIIVNTTLNFATCMLTESALSFLGFGIIEPSPTWGNMLNSAKNSDVMRYSWWRWVYPSLALSISTISINLIGDGLRDAIDPKSNER